MDTTTQYPVVLIHGVFGYGRSRPLWNRFAPYWPEQHLAQLNANHIIVDVGALSSDHDRACEAFYQLVGGRVDYGEQHAREAGHNRFGITFDTPLLAHWSADHPVHLVGHSFGATTAIELYQLICLDYFRVGSDHRWVRSIVSIAGPLSGTTLTHVFGLHDASMRAFTLGHAIGAALGLWFKLHTDLPVLKRVFDFRMPQWECVTSYREVLSATGRINVSADLAVYDILPARRLARNSRLVHMDKLYLASVVTSSDVELPRVELALAAALLLLLLLLLLLSAAGMTRTHATTDSAVSPTAEAAFTAGAVVAAAALAWQLRKRMQQLDYATIPSLHACGVLMTLGVRSLHAIFQGFERHDWEHNDGAVNLHSMRRTWTLQSLARMQPPNASLDASLGASLGAGLGDGIGVGRNRDCDCDSDAHASSASTTASSAASSPRSLSSADLDDDLALDALSGVVDSDSIERPLLDTQRCCVQRGRWYVHRVCKNHMAGTHFDADAPTLFRDVLRVVARDFEGSA